MKRKYNAIPMDKKFGMIVAFIKHRLETEPTPITIHVYNRHTRQSIAGRLNKDLRSYFARQPVNFEPL